MTLGMPNIPEEFCTDIKIDGKGIVKLLLLSIALEELSLSNILNTEGELLQSFLKKIKCSPCFNPEEIIKINRSLCDTIRLLLEKERVLKEKLIEVLHYNEDISYDNKCC